MAHEVEDYYRLCYQRIQRLQGCLGELHWRNAALMSSLCTQPPRSFGLLGQAAKQKLHFFEKFEQRHRIRKSQARTGTVTCAVSWNECVTIPYSQYETFEGQNFHWFCLNRECFPTNFFSTRGRCFSANAKVFPRILTW